MFALFAKSFSRLTTEKTRSRLVPPRDSRTTVHSAAERCRERFTAAYTSRDSPAQRASKQRIAPSPAVYAFSDDA